MFLSGSGTVRFPEPITAVFILVLIRRGIKVFKKENGEITGTIRPDLNVKHPEKVIAAMPLD